MSPSQKNFLFLVLTVSSLRRSAVSSFLVRNEESLTTCSILGHARILPKLKLHDDNDAYPGEDEEDIRTQTSDWVTAEFTLRTAPTTPDPNLDPETVAITCLRNLQFVDYPTESAGLTRCFAFFAWECRKAVTARQGGDTVERFIQHGMFSPALQPFMGAYRVTMGNMTYTPAKPPLRGALASFPVVIHGAPILSVQHMSGMSRTGVGTPPETHFVIRLEQQRRPPMLGCWLVREVLNVRHAFAGDMGNVHVGG